MALVLKDRVKETTTTTGTGTYTLAGAVAGFQAFSAVGNGNTCYYCVENGTDWEVGIGTYTSSGTTLARTTILASSNGGAAVNWGAGTKDVFLTLPAGKWTAVEEAVVALFPVGYVRHILGDDTVPDKWLWFDDGANPISRSTYADLFNHATFTRTGDTANGSAVISNLDSTANMKVGQIIEHPDFAVGTTVQSIDGPDEITVTANASDDNTGTTIRFFKYGWEDGDGSTTFELPDDAIFAVGGTNGILKTIIKAEEG